MRTLFHHLWFHRLDWEWTMIWVILRIQMMLLSLLLISWVRRINQYLISHTRYNSELPGTPLQLVDTPRGMEQSTMSHSHLVFQDVTQSVASLLGILDADASIRSENLNTSTISS